jgi:MFS family permease
MSPGAQPPATPPRPFGPGYKWQVVALLWFVCFLNYADRQAIFSVFPKLKAEFGFDKVELGVIGSAFAWVYAFGAPFAGFIADRARRKSVILNSCVLWSSLTIATAACATKIQFILARALIGLGESFYFPAALSLASDYHGRDTRSKALAFHQSGVYIGSIAGGWAGAWFAELWGWRSGFWILGAAGIILAFVLAGLVREPVRGATDTPGAPGLKPLGPKETLRAIFRSPTAVILMAVFVGANFVATIFLTWTPTFLVEKFGFKLTSAGLSGSIYINLASAASVPLAGILADRWARRRPGGRILVQATGLLLGATFVFWVGAAQTVSVLLASMTCFGLCKGFYDSNIFASLFDAVEPRARATSAGMMNMVGWAGGALGPIYVGWASKYGGRATEMVNMSAAISWCSLIYAAGAAALLIAVFVFAPRDISPPRQAAPS